MTSRNQTKDRETSREVSKLTVSLWLENTKQPGKQAGRNQESEDRTCGQGQKAGAISRIQAGQ